MSINERNLKTEGEKSCPTQLNVEDLFGDTVDKPKQCVVQHRQKECLKGEISKGNTYLLEGKQKYGHRKMKINLNTSKTYAK